MKLTTEAWHKLYDWCLGVDAAHAESNRRVNSRQVRRRRAFKQALTEINATVGGEPRKLRRLMARRKAKRNAA